MADTYRKGLQERQIDSGLAGKTDERNQGKAATLHSGWDAEPNVGRVVDGLPGRVDRLKGLGNAIVPQVAEVIFRAIERVQTGQNQ